MRKLSTILFLLLFVLTGIISSQNNQLSNDITVEIQKYKANVGVAVHFYEKNEIVTVNDDHCYPMQSVYKFPLAIAVLKKVDEGEFSLDQKVNIDKDELLTDTWSPLREKYGQHDIEVTLREILEFTVTQSDNNGCDILFRLLGGSEVVNKYFGNLGVDNINIVATEAEMHAEWGVQYGNCSKPSAMLKILDLFYNGNILSAESQKFLLKIMSVRMFGLNRIQGELPADVTVAHKTGTSDTNEEGVTAATNDVGIVILPDGRAFGIVVYVSDSVEDKNTREKIIARISKLVYDYFNN